jgi:hypothetical protein
LDALKELDTQALGDVPGDVTMEKPGTWVVAFEGDHNPAVTGQHGRVAPSWVVEVESRSIGCVVVPPDANGKRICYGGRPAKHDEVMPLDWSQYYEKNSPDTFKTRAETYMKMQGMLEEHC